MLSVCLATYNGEKYLREQLDSIICQLSETDEIIISDDGSNDNTLTILNQYDDIRIKVFHNEGEHGVVPNFENALRYSSGDYIFLADQDDVWIAGKVAKCLCLLQKYDLVVHNAEIVNGSCESSGYDFFSIRDSKSGFWTNLYKNRFVGCCMCFKREVLSYAIPFPPGILWHDMWIGLIAERHGLVYFEPTSLIKFRRHEDNASPTATKSNFSIFKQITYRLKMLISIIGR